MVKDSFVQDSVMVFLSRFIRLLMGSEGGGVIQNKTGARNNNLIGRNSALNNQN